MGNFSELRYKTFTDDLFVLTESLTYKDRGFKYVVPAGFVTDFVSFPPIPFIQDIFKKDYRLKPCAALHDHMYYVSAGTRKQVDKRFYTALRQVGVSKIKEKLMYTAVRMFGRDHW